MELVLILGFAVAVWFLYHKLFDIYYFDLAGGLGKEIIGSLIAGVILTAITLTYWWVIVIIIAIVALVLVMKYRRTEQKILVAVCAVVIAVIVAATGISFNNKRKEQAQEEAQAYSYVTQDIWES